MPLVEVPSANVHALLARAREVRLGIGKESLNELAALAYLLAQDRAVRREAVLSPKMQRQFEQLEEEERAALRSAVRDVTTALVLLGYLESPGA